MADYEPIDCADHDRLEELATLRRTTRITYRADDGEAREFHGRIADLYARDGIEYMRTDNGEEIRLDQLQQVEAQPHLD